MDLNNKIMQDLNLSKTKLCSNIIKEAQVKERMKLGRVLALEEIKDLST
jgi:hypothetical protein